MAISSDSDKISKIQKEQFVEVTRADHCATFDPCICLAEEEKNGHMELGPL